MKLMHAINKVSHQNKLGIVSWVPRKSLAGCRTMTIAQGREFDGPHFAFYLFSINPRSQVYLFNWPHFVRQSFHPFLYLSALRLRMNEPTPLLVTWHSLPVLPVGKRQLSTLRTRILLQVHFTYLPPY
jgi:hypothetical protein